jgi:hypothetical protein
MRPFTIGQGQLAAFREDAERRYIAAVADFLKKNVPEAAEDDPQSLTAFVSAMVPKAKSYGLTTRRHAAIYVTTSYLLGEGFEEHFDIAHRVLTSTHPAPDKVEWLQQATISLLNSPPEKRG